MAEATDDRLRLPDVEVWLPVVGYEGLYEVSNLGRCRRIATGLVLSPVRQSSGYLTVSLSSAGDVRNYRLHRLVLIAFCGSEPFDGAIAAHNDGNRENCQLTNLRWASPVENQADRVRHGTMRQGSAVYGAVLTENDVSEIRRRLAAGERNPPIANDFGVSISTIHLIRHRRTWRHVA
jgi:hypothetical protein